MKTKFLFGALAAFGMMTACSSDETADVEKPKGEGTESYVSFSIVSTNTSGTRADESTAEFGEAEGNEAKIDNVVLLFYDNDNNAINVNMGSTNTNYKILTASDFELKGAKDPVGTEEPTTNNVEHWFKKTIALTTASNLTEARVLAVVNANVKDGVLCNNEDTPVSGSTAKTAFFTAPFPGSYTKNDANFVMTTSVYAGVDAEKDKVYSDVAIQIFDNEADAEKNSATIYVERVRARAKVIASSDNTVKDDKDLYKVEIDKSDLRAEDAEKTFKIKVLGWDLNTTAKRAYLFKQITPPYDFQFPWNDPVLHRSYWENPFNHTETSAYDTSFTPNKITSQPGDPFKYCNPNTTNIKTKILVYTQLIDMTTNKPADIATWYSNNYTLEGLKSAVLKASPKVVYVAGEGDSYVNIDETYLDFEQGEGRAAEMDRSWMAYPILKTKLDGDTENIVYYKKVQNTGTGGTVITNFEEVTAEQAMQLIGFQDARGNHVLQGARVWNEGRAYYFVDVKHLGAMYGMVRNHSYTIRIDGFYGLGTPIFNPDQIIPEPTLPEDDKKSYVSVTMNVLSWRIIPTQGVIFGEKEKK